MATQAVRVRHNGQVSSLEIIAIDETDDGGAEVFRQLAEKLDLPDSRKMKVVHRGKLLSSKEVCKVLRQDPKAIIQANTYSSGVLGRIGLIIIVWLRGMWLFLLTFWPGYDGRRVEGLHTEGDRQAEEEAAARPVRYVRRIETSAQRCRDEINTELVDRGTDRG